MLETTPPSKKLVPRKVLLLSGTALGVGAIAKNEMQVTQEGIVTPNAIFTPMYEEHSKGVSKERIPSNLDILFKELVLLDGNPYDIPSAYLFLASNPDGSPSQAFNEGVFEKLAKQNTKIMFGDVNYPDIVSSTNPLFLESVIGAVATTAGILYSKIADELDSQPPPAEQTRRIVIKTALFGLGTWGSSPATIKPLHSVMSDKEQPNAVDRILIRLHGIQSHFHPEDAKSVFRNAVIADKLLTVAEGIKNETGRKARIGVIIGGGHGGIEDFLMAGQEICRTVVNAYPKDFLKKTVELNGGLDNFSSARLLTLPTQLKMEELHASDIESRIKDERIIDTKLSIGLKNKLND